jgi:hypothetical protein
MLSQLTETANKSDWRIGINIIENKISKYSDDIPLL